MTATQKPATMASSNTGWLKGQVKEVVSGDTLVVMALQGMPPAEKRLTLSSLEAPKLARRDGTSDDEPFAWQSREFLRTMTIGKQCIFKTDYRVDAIGRDFGSIFINSKDNVALAVVQNGWAKVKSRQGQESPYQEKLLELEEEATKKEIGIFNKDQQALLNAVRSAVPSNDPHFDAVDFIDTHGKSVSLSAVVDQVLNGGLIKVQLMAPEHMYRVLMVQVAGVQCPRLPGRSDSNATPDPGATEAKHFTEKFTLGREVRVILEAADKNNSIIGQVKYANSADTVLDLAEQLLGLGLGKVSSWSSQHLSTGAARLHGAERHAKQNRIGLWKSYAPPVTSQGSLSAQFSGNVVEVVSGDTIVVLDASQNPPVERRVTLSSIRVPKIRGADGKAEPWAIDGKELLRKRCIGKEVSVTIEYSREMPPAQGARGQSLDTKRWFGNVTMQQTKPDNKKETEDLNLAQMMVKRGFAEVVLHRQDDERSSIYDLLLQAEQTAKQAHQGIHGNKQHMTGCGNDISLPGNAARAKQFLGFLQRQPVHSAVCEHVMSGHRIKLSIPKEGVVIAFAPSGVKSPARAQPAREKRPATQAEPFAEESMSFTRRIFLQRDVEVSIDSVDKGGTFQGTVHLAGQRDQNLGTLLLKSGLGSVHPYFERSGGAEHLMALQQAAQQAKLKIWEKYDPTTVQSVDDNEADAGAAGAGQSKEVMGTATEVCNGSSIYMQFDTGSATLKKILEGIKTSDPSNNTSVTGTYGRGEYVLGQFSVDQEWYRGFVTDVRGSGSPNPSYNVFFIDYGNSEEMQKERMRPMSGDLKAIPPQCHQCQLALLKVKGVEDDIGYEAATLLSQIVRAGEGMQLKVKVLQSVKSAGSKHPGEANGTKLVVLQEDGEEVSVNGKLLQEGLAQLVRRRYVKGWMLDEYTTLEPCLQSAKDKRLGMFEYGDPGDSEDEL